MRRAFFVVLIVVMGCSNGTLDRKTVMEKMNQAFTKYRVRILVRIGRVGSHCEKRTDSTGTYDLDLDPAVDPNTVIANAAGYVQIVPDGPGFWKVSFSDKGQKFVKHWHVTTVTNGFPSNCGYQLYALPLATAQVSQVTGIIPDAKRAQVDLVWNWNLTELGQGLTADGKIYNALTDIQRQFLKDWVISSPRPVLPIPVPTEEQLKTPHHDTVLFIKYDDGWRPMAAKAE